jgi:hypothetical protein
MRMDVEMNVFHGIFSKEILFPLPNLGGEREGVRGLLDYQLKDTIRFTESQKRGLTF